LPQATVHIQMRRPKVSKGSEALPPPVAGEGRAQEASEKEQSQRQRCNATIELAGLIGNPFGRARRREFLFNQRPWT